MAKQRAFGADAVFLIGKESAYGTPPSVAGSYFRAPLRSNSVGGSRPLEEDLVINRGNADDSDPSRGNETVDGAISAPIDSRGAGDFLKIVFGDAVSAADDDLFEHTFKSGKDLHSYALQSGHPKLSVPKWWTVRGAKAVGLNFSLSRSGRAVLEIPMLGQSEQKDDAGVRDSAPVVRPYLPFDNAGGGVKLNGVAASVTAGSFAYLTSLEADETIRPDGYIDGVEEGIRKLSGSVTMRLGANTTIVDLGDAHTPGALEFSFALPAKPGWGLKFTMPRVFFEKPKKPIEGPGGISVTCNWRAALDETAGCMVIASLVNDVATY